MIGLPPFYVPVVMRVFHNSKRQEFISREDIQKVLDACPDNEWRLIFALARYGGLRIPSELYGLIWDDILWDKERFVIHSPKTEHNEGKKTLPYHLALSRKQKTVGLILLPVLQQVIAICKRIQFRTI